MKYSANGLYVEEYRKCINCGELIYDRGLVYTNDDGSKIGPFSSVWDMEWYQERESRHNTKSLVRIKEWRSEEQS